MRNFGIINETFKDILIEEIGLTDSKNKVMFSKYVKELKSNNVLRAQYHTYNNIENKVETDKIKSLEYIKESILLLKKIGVKEIIKENEKLVKFLTKNGYELTKDYKRKELHENLHKMIVTDKNTKNLDSILESAYFISDYMVNNAVVLKESSKSFYSNKAVGTIMIDKYNTKYSNISESEKLIIKTIISGNVKDKEELYSGMVKECIELVNTQLKECSIDEKDKLLQVKEKLLRLSYVEHEFLVEIDKIINLKNNLK